MKTYTNAEMLGWPVAHPSVVLPILAAGTIVLAYTMEYDDPVPVAIVTDEDGDLVYRLAPSAS